MYVKIKDDGTVVFPYTFSDLRKENPKTSFTAEPSEALLREYNVFVVEQDEVPFCDRNLHTVKSELVPLASDRFAYKHTLVPTERKYAEKRMRVRRDRMLSATDWAGSSDVTMSDEMRSYRQALRDITKQKGFPYSITWPEIPE